MKIDFILDEGSSKEDACLIKDNILGVFDGFNSLNGFVDEDGETGGFIAAEIAKDEFSKNNKSLLNLTIEANRKIGKKMAAVSIDISNKRNVWGCLLAVVRLKNNSFEWIQIGDPLILIIYKNNTFKTLIKDYDHDKELLSAWKRLAKQKKEIIRELIDKKYLTELRSKMNKVYGGLIGEEEAITFIKKGEENLKNIKHILLFTDGLFIPKEDPLGNDDWNMFVQLFLEGGLKKIKDFVRNLEKGDPKCWKYPRYKQYDDIAGISISFET